MAKMQTTLAIRDAQLFDGLAAVALPGLGHNALEMVLEADILALIKQGELEDYISILPSIQNIEDALADSDVMLAPSLWEGFPNSVAEALAFGVPVAGFSDCEGVRDLIQNDVNGWILDRTDPVLSQLKLLEKIVSEQSKIVNYSSNAKLSMIRYQDETSLNLWSQTFSNLAR